MLPETTTTSTAAWPDPDIHVLLDGFSIGSEEGALSFCGVFLIEGADRGGERRRIIVDTGHVGRREPLLGALSASGIAVDSIDQVVLTHAHWDHIQNLDVFPNAEIVLHRAENAYAQRPHPNDIATPTWTRLLFAERRLREVGGDDELLPGVAVIEAPGHTPGSIAVGVATADGLAVVTGDAIPNARAAQLRRNTLVFWDDAQATRTVENLLRVGDLFYPGHDRPFRVDGDNIEHLRPFRFTLLGAEPGAAGFAQRAVDPESRWIMPGAAGSI